MVFNITHQISTMLTLNEFRRYTNFIMDTDNKFDASTTGLVFNAQTTPLFGGGGRLLCQCFGKINANRLPIQTGSGL